MCMYYVYVCCGIKNEYADISGTALLVRTKNPAAASRGVSESVIASMGAETMANVRPPIKNKNRSSLKRVLFSGGRKTKERNASRPTSAMTLPAKMAPPITPRIISARSAATDSYTLTRKIYSPDESKSSCNQSKDNNQISHQSKDDHGAAVHQSRKTEQHQNKSTSIKVHRVLYSRSPFCNFRKYNSMKKEIGFASVRNGAPYLTPYELERRAYMKGKRKWMGSAFKTNFRR